MAKDSYPKQPGVFSLLIRVPRDPAMVFLFLARDILTLPVGVAQQRHRQSLVQEGTCRWIYIYIKYV